MAPSADAETFPLPVSAHAHAHHHVNHSYSSHSHSHGFPSKAVPVSASVLHGKLDLRLVRRIQLPSPCIDAAPFFLSVP